MLYERNAFVMVEADSLEEAEAAFAEVDGTSFGLGNVGVALEDSPAYEVDD